MQNIFFWFTNRSGTRISGMQNGNSSKFCREDRELIRRAKRDGREARGNEEREKRED